jgi:hypothetical protein
MMLIKKGHYKMIIMSVITCCVCVDVVETPTGTGTWTLMTGIEKDKKYSQFWR